MCGVRLVASGHGMGGWGKARKRAGNGSKHFSFADAKAPFSHISRFFTVPGWDVQACDTKSEYQCEDLRK